MNFIELIKERAKKDIKTIVLPESMDSRVMEAASKILEEGVANIIIIGTPEEIEKSSIGFDVSKATIIDPYKSEMTENLILKLVELRKNKGLTYEDAKNLLLNDYMYYACMLVKEGLADGCVSGACHSTSNTLRPALQIIKTAPNIKTASAFFLMDVPDCIYGDNGLFVYSDCGMIQNPTSEELVEIAKSSADTYELLVEKTPYIAFLSHSTKGSSKCPDQDKVLKAVNYTKEKYPELICDGELQFDAAIIKEVAEVKAPNSEVAGRANVLIFPDLDAGNIGYKITERLAKAKAYGPITQGLDKPINDLSRGCNELDIVGVVAITALQAQKKS